MTAVEIEQEPLTSSSIPAEGTTAGERTRRVINVLIAVVGLILTAPVMAIIAVLVRMTSPGPVFYTQPRVGVDRRGRTPGRTDSRRRVDIGGQPFRIFKFRTMRVHRERGVWARPDDDRVTPIGRLLRKYRLDELPQLVNVIRGDMNIVGPRPEQPGIFADLRQSIEGYPERQQVLPGITGWAQINQSYDTSLGDVERKLAFDLNYLERRSPVEDLRIMARTLPVMIFRRGAW